MPWRYNIPGKGLAYAPGEASIDLSETDDGATLVVDASDGEYATGLDRDGVLRLLSGLCEWLIRNAKR